MSAGPRIAPPCPHFGTCGGCSLLDRSIDEQLARKRAAVIAALGAHLGDVEPVLDPPRSVPRHTRTKLLYPAVPDPDGRLVLGLYERGSHRIVRIRECQLQDRALTRFGRRAEAELRELRVQPWDEAHETGFLRALSARVMPGTGELLLGVVTRPGLFEDAAAVADALYRAAQGSRDPRGRPMRIVGVVRNIQPDTGNALLGARSLPLRGHDHQIDRARGLEFRVGFGSFYQAHRAVEAILYRPAMAMLGDVAGRRVLDAYGGVGGFAMRLAAADAAHVDLVETHPVACRDAEHNARVNGFASRVTVHRAALGEWRSQGGFDLGVLDPPRKGLGDDGIATLAALAIPRLMYVSCAPSALGRDLDGLAALGYRPVAVRLVDLFPHTEHVETLVLLERHTSPRRS